VRPKMAQGTKPAMLTMQNPRAPRTIEEVSDSGRACGLFPVCAAARVCGSSLNQDTAPPPVESPFHRQGAGGQGLSYSESGPARQRDYGQDLIETRLLTSSHPCLFPPAATCSPATPIPSMHPRTGGPWGN